MSDKYTGVKNTKGRFTMFAEQDSRIQAKYYESEYTFRDDVELYLRMAGKIRGEVLELACGSGRVLIPFAEAGYRITGLDIAPLMLEKAADRIKSLPANVRRRIALIEGDMRKFSLRKKYQLVLLVFNSFVNLTSREDQKIILKKIYRHLAPDGRLIVSVINPNRSWFREKIPVVKFYGTWEYEKSGEFFERFYFNTHDPQTQRMTFNLVYDTINKDGSVRRDRNMVPIHYLNSFELQYMLEHEGFTINNLFGDHEGESFRPDSPVMIFEALKKKTKVNRNKK